MDELRMVQASLNWESISSYLGCSHLSKPCGGKFNLQSFAGVKKTKNNKPTGNFASWRKI